MFFLFCQSGVSYLGNKSTLSAEEEKIINRRFEWRLFSAEQETSCTFSLFNVKYPFKDRIGALKFYSVGMNCGEFETNSFCNWNAHCVVIMWKEKQKLSLM